MLAMPDYKHSIINVAASIKKYYRIPTNIPTIEKLDLALNRMYKNVVLILIGGMGENLLRDSLLPSDFLISAISDTITSICPSLPAVASVSSITGLSPNRHCRLGQTLFFKEFCRMIELETNLDPCCSQLVTAVNAADFVIPYKSYFDEIANSIIGNVQPFSISMKGTTIPENKSFHKTAESSEKMSELIAKICATDQNTFTYVQWNELRIAAAAHGSRSAEVRDILRNINNMLKELSKRLKDTLVIVASDHGVTDISEEISLNSNYALCDCLIMPPSFGSRAVNFFVKPDMKNEFERIFKESYREDFLLMSRSEILRKEILGTGKPDKKVYDFLGDFTAFAFSDKSMHFRTLSEKHKARAKAGSGGITTDEMILPLIILQTGRTLNGRYPFTQNITPFGTA